MSFSVFAFTVLAVCLGSSSWWNRNITNTTGWQAPQNQSLPRVLHVVVDTHCFILSALSDNNLKQECGINISIRPDFQSSSWVIWHNSTFSQFLFLNIKHLETVIWDYIVYLLYADNTGSSLGLGVLLMCDSQILVKWLNKKTKRCQVQDWKWVKKLPMSKAKLWQNFRKPGELWLLKSKT